MRIAGEGAQKYQAVRTDSLETVNHGPLVSADDETGNVVWKDRAGETRSVTLGPNAIRLAPAYRYGRS